jgi:DNA-binding GntR family transcriptional regulator
LMDATLARDSERAVELLACHIRATAENIMHKVPLSEQSGS